MRRGSAGKGALGVLGGDGMMPVAALLRAAGVAVIDAEPPPLQTPDDLARRYGFGFASVRCGALPTLRQVLQLVQSALGGTLPERWIWTDAAGGFIDALRPGIEPPCPTRAEVEANRRAHLAAVAGLVAGAETLVVPLASVEALAEPAHGTVYPSPIPGSKPPRGVKPVAIAFDATAMDADMAALLGLVRGVNPGVKLRVLVLPGAASAGLQGLAQGWTGRFPGVLHDGIVDDLVLRCAAPEADPRVGLLLSRLIAAPDAIAALIDAIGAAPAEPAGEPKRSRAERRAARAARKRPDGENARLVCEDELLEAFS